MGQLIGPFNILIGSLAMPFSILCIVALTNASNMIDGIDGLAGGTLAVMLTMLIIVFGLIATDARADAGLAKQAHDTMIACGVILGAISGFLALNQRGFWRKSAAIFLGDSGSMMLGFMVAALGAIGLVSWRYGVAQYLLGWGFAVLFLGYLYLSSALWSKLESTPPNQRRFELRRRGATLSSGQR